MREKAIRDEKNGLRSAREEGIAEGIERNRKEIAKAMLKEKMSIAQIAKITGLSKEETLSRLIGKIP